MLDFNNVLFRAICAMPELSYRGKPTGGLCGFVKQFFSYINRYKPSAIVVVTDQSPYLRNMLYEDYKRFRSRVRDPDKLRTIQLTRQYCSEFLEMVGVSLLSSEGYEADDWIATICAKYSNSGGVFESIVVVSNDSDLFQIFQYGDHVYLHRGGGGVGLYGLWEFKRDYPAVHPVSWPQVMALTGGHNGLPGIKGIGIKRAIKIVGDGEAIKCYQRDEEFQQWVRLTMLPFDDTLYNGVELSEVRFDEDLISNHLLKYGIRNIRVSKY